MESGRRSKHSSRDIVKFRGGLREVIRSDERSHMTAGSSAPGGAAVRAASVTAASAEIATVTSE
jgi:hypothetical protein